MYHVRVIGPSEALTQALGPEGADWRYTEGPDADIALVDRPDADLAQVRAGLPPHGLLVLCWRPGTAGAGEADELWELPLDPALTRLRFSKLLERLARERERERLCTYLDTLMDIVPDMIWFKDLEGNHFKLNDAFCQIVGKDKADILGRDHCYIWDVSREEFERGEFVCKETDEYVLKERKPCTSTEVVKSQQGMRQFSTYKAPLLDPDGTLLGSVGVGHDVTDLKNMGLELEIVLNSVPFAILVWNKDGVILNANAHFEEYFGVGREQILGRQYRTWAAEAFTSTKPIPDTGNLEVELSLAGRVKTLEIHEETIFDFFHNEVGALGIYRDITAERAMERQILQSSQTDFLTGLYNRRGFYRHIRERGGREPLSLLYIDLDHFKRINDTYGHQAGDEVLVQMAGLLRDCFPDEFLARIGGDEFLVAIFGQHDRAALAGRAARFLDRTAAVFAQSCCPLSASIGIAQSGEGGLDIDQLIRQSDNALYRAKLLGRARWCFYQE